MVILSTQGILQAESSTSIFFPGNSIATPVGEEKQTKVSGVLEELGPGFVIVNGVRFDIVADLKVKNKEGRLVSNWFRALRPSIEVEMTVENDLVQEIQIVELVK